VVELAGKLSQLAVAADLTGHFADLWQKLLELILSGDTTESRGFLWDDRRFGLRRVGSHDSAPLDENRFGANILSVQTECCGGEQWQGCCSVAWPACCWE
jgi:hypothetical protein